MEGWKRVTCVVIEIQLSSHKDASFIDCQVVENVFFLILKKIQYFNRIFN